MMNPIRATRWVTGLTAAAVLAASAPSAEPPEDARSEYRELQKAYNAALEEFEAEVAKLEESDAAEAAEYAASWNPTAGFVEAFAEAAQRYAGTDEAIQFLEWIVFNDDTAGEGLSEASTAALDTLIDQHAENEDFFGTIRYLGFRGATYGEERVRAVCARVIERADTELALAGQFARGVSRVGRNGTSDADAELALVDFRAVLEQAPENEVAGAAKGYLFELENLRIGMVAPDITERDLDGVNFNLSDYRGKVVVLDFWGDW